MTRDEAYRRAMSACEEIWNDKIYKQIKEALWQEPCEDAISRQAVLKLFATHDGRYLYEAIRDLPSVTPTVTEFADKCRECGKQRTGHWIFEEGDGKTCFDGYVCSACNKSFHTHVPYFAEYEFCPHCGADMRESEEQA